MYKLPALNRRQQLETDPSKATKGSNDFQMQPLSTRYESHPAQGMHIPDQAASVCSGPNSAILF
ncbi:unnamed protein product [Bubo scandiacus]